MVYKALLKRMKKHGRKKKRSGREAEELEGRKERTKKKINDSGMDRWCCESREVLNLDGVRENLLWGGALKWSLGYPIN